MPRIANSNGSASLRKSRSAAPPAPLAVPDARHAHEARAGDDDGGGRPAEPRVVARSKPAGDPPAFIPPQLCTPVVEPPREPGLVHEVKIDGYRVLARKHDRDVALLTRTGLDWTDRYPDVARAVAALPARRALLDGELTVVDREGRHVFEALQRAAAGREPGASIVLFAFDLLSLDDRDLREEPLLERKRLLAALLEGTDGAAIRYVPHEAGDASALLERMRSEGHEGLVSKRASAPYRSGRTGSWFKLRLRARQEVVVIGYTLLTGDRDRIGALLVATHGPDGALRPAGKVGSGFSDGERRELLDELRPLERAAPPVAERPRVAGRVQWVEPRLVIEVAYRELTSTGQLRQASFFGVRRDKDAGDVTLDQDAAGAVPPTRSPQAALPPPLRRAVAPLAGEAERDVVSGVHITHPTRPLFPADPTGLVVTKHDVARYMEAVAPLLLPFVADRPLSIVRCPDDAGAACFFQKHVGRGMPASVGSIAVDEEQGERAAIAISDVSGLVGLVQMGALELHPWGRKARDPETPDRVVFDLDPAPGVAWSAVAAAARAVREKLAEAGLVGFVMTTGGKGLHVVTPLGGAPRWAEVKAFARRIAEALADEAPALYTADIRKAAREGRVFIDPLRNGRGATAIAPWSMRARPGAPVATPIPWSAVDDVRGASFSILNLHDHLEAGGASSWAEYATTPQRLPSPWVPTRRAS